MMSIRESNGKTLVDWSRRLQRGRVLLLALGVVVATSVGAQAADLCMDYSGGGSMVLKRFKIPRRNTCAPVQGFENARGSGHFMSGMGCTNLNGSLLVLEYTSNSRYYPHYFETGVCEIALPVALNGSFGSCSGGWSFTPPGDKINYFGEEVTLRSCNVDLLYGTD